ncbi:MAG: hypothetical protein CL477_19490 [Acidobacteria bacterium]|jgi:uncharacterized protein YdcH (DUF465 family)|nr:hypothetical protein [Acidobacteriota bacterium]
MVPFRPGTPHQHCQADTARQGGGMATETQQLKDHLLQTDHGFRQLVEQHQELDTRLQVLAHQNYLSEMEQTEEVTLKKQKLQLKDQIQGILRRHRDPQTA